MTGVGLHIRPVAEQDMPAITDIYADAVARFSASWEWQAPDLAEMTARKAAILEDGFPYIIAQQGDDLAGYAYASSFRDRTGYQWVVEDTVYVHPDHYRAGIGASLLRELIRLCTDQGFRLMVAVIGGGENTGSIRLHEKAGFEHAGKLENAGWKNDCWHDWLLMSRPLAQSLTEPPQPPHLNKKFG